MMNQDVGEAEVVYVEVFVVAVVVLEVAEVVDVEEVVQEVVVDLEVEGDRLIMLHHLTIQKSKRCFPFTILVSLLIKRFNLLESRLSQSLKKDPWKRRKKL